MISKFRLYLNYKVFVIQSFVKLYESLLIVNMTKESDLMEIKLNKVLGKLGSDVCLLIIQKVTLIYLYFNVVASEKSSTKAALSSD